MTLHSQFFAATLLMLTACDDAPTARGFGRAPVHAASPAPRLAVTLTRVYAPTTLPTGATAFVEAFLQADADDIDLTHTPLYVLSRAGLARLPQRIWTHGTSVHLTGASLMVLDIRANADELALVDAQMNLHAYAAWGADPKTFSRSFIHAATARGLAAAAVRSGLPYPMDDTLAVALSPNAATACISSDPNVDSQSPEAAISCPGATALVQLSRVQPQSLDTPQGYVEVYSSAAGLIDLHGATLCIDNSCGPIEVEVADANAALPAGYLAPATNPNLGSGNPDQGRALVLVGAHSDAAALTSFVHAPSLTALTAQSEVALFAPGHAASDHQTAALSYVRLGTGAASAQQLPLLTAAQSPEAALWAAQGLTAPRLAEETQARAVQSPQSLGPQAWALSATPPLQVLDDPKTPWTSCTMPQMPALADALRMTEIAWDQTARIVLHNTGQQPLDVTPYSLQLGDKQLSLASYLPLVPPNSDISIALSSTSSPACTAGQDMCWTGAQAALDAASLSLLHQGATVGHVQWGPMQTGAATMATTTAQDAVARGVWPNLDCRIAAFTAGPVGSLPYKALRLLPDALGQSPADYFIGVPTRR